MNMARNAVVALVLTSALATSACSSDNPNKQLFAWTGAAIGAAVGGWAGSQLGGGTG